MARKKKNAPERGRLLLDVLPEEVRAACDRHQGADEPDWSNPHLLAYVRWCPPAIAYALARGLPHAGVRILEHGEPVMVTAPVGSESPGSAVQLVKVVFCRYALSDVLECVGVTDVGKYVRVLADLLGKYATYERIRPPHEPA